MERVVSRRHRNGVPSRFARHTLALPTGLLWLLFFAAPIAILIAYSFGKIDILTFQVTWDWTVENYRNIVDELYLSTIGRSLLLALGATLACLLIGFPVAYQIARQPPRRQQLLLLAVVVPFWTSFIVRTYAWIQLLQNGGPVESAVNWLGLSSGTLDILYTPTSIAIGIVASYLPLMVFPLFIALDRIDPTLRQAASDLGANDFRTFRRVTLPLAMPGIVAGCILVGVPATGEYVIPAILGGGKTLMFGNVIAGQFLNVGDYPFGAALATAFMVGLTIVLVVTRRKVAAAEHLAS